MKLESPPEKKRPTMADYDKLLRDRPRKWSAETVAYRKADSEEKCGNCAHFYIGRAHNVCEIFRPKTETEDVNPDWTCDWFTADLTEYPLLGRKGEEEPSSSPRS